MMNYEMISPFDPFGETMMSNLAARGCDLYGIEACHSVELQSERLVRHLGPSDTLHLKTLKMTEVYNKCLDGAEKTRIEKLEMFDEFEEWVLLQDHYCIAFGSRGLAAQSKRDGGEECVSIL